MKSLLLFSLSHYEREILSSTGLNGQVEKGGHPFAYYQRPASIMPAIIFVFFLTLDLDL